MPIVIPTYGRPFRQKTFHNLPESLKFQTYFAIRAEEAKYFQHNTLILPADCLGIAAARDFIVSIWPDQKIIMMDDDLEFAIRRRDDPTKFIPAGGERIEEMVAELYGALNRGFAHASVSGREGANRNTTLVLYNGRAMRVLAYDAKVLTKHGIKFTPYTLMCDFGVTLELLTRGYGNVILNEFVHNQAGSDTSGGCSLHRTFDSQWSAAEYLHARFPEFVTVVKKQTKTSWQGKERYDVRIQWKRAYESGKAAVLDEGEGKSSDSQGVPGAI